MYKKNKQIYILEWSGGSIPVFSGKFTNEPNTTGKLKYKILIIYFPSITSQAKHVPCALTKYSIFS
jgi:hypothetical protein